MIVQLAVMASMGLVLSAGLEATANHPSADETTRVGGRASTTSTAPSISIVPDEWELELRAPARIRVGEELLAQATFRVVCPTDMTYRLAEPTWTLDGSLVEKADAPDWVVPNRLRGGTSTRVLNAACLGEQELRVIQTIVWMDLHGGELGCACMSKVVTITADAPTSIEPVAWAASSTEVDSQIADSFRVMVQVYRGPLQGDPRPLISVERARPPAGQRPIAVRIETVGPRPIDAAFRVSVDLPNGEHLTSKVPLVLPRAEQGGTYFFGLHVPDREPDGIVVRLTASREVAARRSTFNTIWRGALAVPISRCATWLNPQDMEHPLAPAVHSPVAEPGPDFEEARVALHPIGEPWWLGWPVPVPNVQ